MVVRSNFRSGKMGNSRPLWALDWLCLKGQNKINMYLNMIGKVPSEDTEEPTRGHQRTCGTENP